MSAERLSLRRALPLKVAAALVLAAGVARAQEPSRPLDLATYPRTSLEITHHGSDQVTRKYPFTVWIADTDQRAEQGLMFVSDLPDNLGMVFPMEPPRVATFWMKNTYIELDMLFIGADGRVTKIIPRAAPMSLRPLSSDSPVNAVLELKGGVAAKLGLRPGDSVVWKKSGT